MKEGKKQDEIKKQQFKKQWQRFERQLWSWLTFLGAAIVILSLLDSDTKSPSDDLFQPIQEYITKFFVNCKINKGLAKGRQSDAQRNNVNLTLDSSSRSSIRGFGCFKTKLPFDECAIIHDSINRCSGLAKWNIRFTNVKLSARSEQERVNHWREVVFIGDENSQAKIFFSLPAGVTYMVAAVAIKKFALFTMHQAVLLLYSSSSLRKSLFLNLRTFVDAATTAESPSNSLLLAGITYPLLSSRTFLSPGSTDSIHSGGSMEVVIEASGSKVYATRRVNTNKTKQNKTKQNKTKQNKTKQNKTK